LKQQWLFDGYVRAFIVMPDQQYIPNDVYQLASTFFHVDIVQASLDMIPSNPKVTALSEMHHMLLLRKDSIWRLYKFSMHLYKQTCEFWLAYEILKALSLFYSDSYRYWNGLGLVLDKWDNFEEAEASYKVALQLKPGSHIFRWNYGLLLKKYCKFDISAKLFVEASALDPNEARIFLQCGGLSHTIVVGRTKEGSEAKLYQSD